MMKEVYWRDEKLYRIAARDYGDLIHRSFAVIVNSIAKGMAFAVVVVVIFLSTRLLNDLGRDWYVLFLPLVLVCAIYAGFQDRSLYVCEIEIRTDRLVRHSRGKTSVVEIATLREISEGRHWTLFGWVHGLRVRGKETSIVIPTNYREYSEIKSRLSACHPVAI